MGKISDLTAETNPLATDDILMESYANGESKKIARNLLLSSKNLTSLPTIIDNNDTLAVSDDSDGGKAKKMTLGNIGSLIASGTFSAVNGSYFDLVGDGVTNNYDAFVEAIDYCILNNLDLILTAGVYYIDPGSGVTLDFSDVTVVFKRGAKIKLLRADGGITKFTDIKAGKYQIFEIDWFNDNGNPLSISNSFSTTLNCPEWFGAINSTADNSIDQAKINSDAIMKAHLAGGKVYYSSTFRCYYPVAWRPTLTVGESPRTRYISFDGETERTTQITVTATTGTDFVLGLWRATRVEDTLDDSDDVTLEELSDPRIYNIAGAATATLTASNFITANKATIESNFDGVTITSNGAVITIVESTMNRVDIVKGGSVTSDVYDMPGFENQTYYYVKNYDIPIHSRWGYDIRLNYNDGSGAPTTKTTGAALTNGDVYTNLSGTVYVRVNGNWKTGVKRENFFLCNHPTKPRLNINDFGILVENVYTPTSYVLKLEFAETHSVNRVSVSVSNCELGGYWISEYGMGPCEGSVLNFGEPAGNVRCNDYTILLNADRAIRLTSLNYRCGYPRKGWKFIGPVTVDGSLIEHSPDPRVDYVFLASSFTTAPTIGDIYSNNGSEFTVFGVGAKYIFTTRTSETIEPLASGDLTAVDLEYSFTVSGIGGTGDPEVGDTYTNNSSTFTITEVTLTGTAPTRSGTIKCNRSAGTNNPSASGTLTRTSGTGDASVTFSVSSYADNTIPYASISTGFRTYLSPQDGNCLVTFFPDSNGNPVLKNTKLTMSLAATNVFYVSIMSDKNGRNDFLVENCEVVTHPTDDVAGNVDKLLTIGHYGSLDNNATSVIIKSFGKDYFFNTDTTSIDRRGLVINRLTLKDIELGNEHAINSGQSSFICETISDGVNNFEIKLPVLHKPLNQTSKDNSGSYLIMISGRRQSTSGNTRAGGALFFVTVGKSTSADYDVEITCLSNTYSNLTGNHRFTVSGVTVAPAVGQTYTNNGSTYTVVSSTISGGSGTIEFSVTARGNEPETSGILTESGTPGVGDTTITFSEWATAQEGTPLWAIDTQSTGINSEQVIKAKYTPSAYGDGGITSISYSVWALQANTRGNS